MYIKQSIQANYDQFNYFTITDNNTLSITVTQESPANGFGFGGGPALVNGLSYDVKVVTVTTANAAEMSANTAEANKVPRSVPGAPVLVEPLDIGDNLVLSWAAPANDGGAPITSYAVQFDNSPCALAIPTATTCNVAKPTLPGTYAYQVTAHNSAGHSMPATRTFTVDAITPTPTPSPSISDSAATAKSTSPAIASENSTMSPKPDSSEPSAPSPITESEASQQPPELGATVNPAWLWQTLGALLILGMYWGLRSQRRVRRGRRGISRSPTI